MEYGYAGASAENPGLFSKVHTKFALLLCHNFPVLIRHERPFLKCHVVSGICPLIVPLSPVTNDGLDKSGEIYLMNLWYIITGDIVSPVVSRFRILNIPNIQSGIPDHLDLKFMLQGFSTITYFNNYLINIISWLHHIDYNKDGGIFNILHVILEECLLHKLVRLIPYLSQIIYGLIPFFD